MARLLLPAGRGRIDDPCDIELRLVSPNDLVCPCDCIAGAYPYGLRAGPEFQVLRPVVVPDAIQVMNVLSGQEIAAQQLFHDQNVLEDIPRFIRARMARRQNHHVPAAVPRAAAPPVTIRRPLFGTTGGTGGGVLLLARPAGAEIV